MLQRLLQCGRQHIRSHGKIATLLLVKTKTIMNARRSALNVVVRACPTDVMAGAKSLRDEGVHRITRQKNQKIRSQNFAGLSALAYCIPPTHMLSP